MKHKYLCNFKRSKILIQLDKTVKLLVLIMRMTSSINNPSNEEEVLIDNVNGKLLFIYIGIPSTMFTVEVGFLKYINIFSEPGLRNE